MKVIRHKTVVIKQHAFKLLRTTNVEPDSLMQKSEYKRGLDDKKGKKKKKMLDFKRRFLQRNEKRASRSPIANDLNSKKRQNLNKERFPA